MENTAQEIIDALVAHEQLRHEPLVQEDRESIKRTLTWIRGLIAQKLEYLSNGKEHKWRALEAFSPITNPQEEDELMRIQMELDGILFLLSQKAGLATIRHAFQRTLKIHKPSEESAAVGHIYALLTSHRAFEVLQSVD